MKEYRKKPVVVRAAQWIPGVNDAEIEAVGMVNHGDQETTVHIGRGIYKVPAGKGLIPTLEGPHIISPGDWLIQGVNGEFYPCKPDIFAKTYDLYEEEGE